jgi:hypothetical protein
MLEKKLKENGQQEGPVRGWNDLRTTAAPAVVCGGEDGVHTF